MATVIVLSDIHGNLAALEAVWRDISRRPFDALFCLGDVAAFGPAPDECITFLRDVVQPTATIAGNTDRYLVQRSWERAPDDEPQRALAWAHGRLSDGGRAWLAALPATHRATLGGVDVELVHGAPGNDELGIGPAYAGARVAAAQSFDHDVVAPLFAQHGPGITFCGHTHIPWRVQFGARRVINVGSVGYPFDGDSRAAYARVVVADGDLQEYECRRVSYNTDGVVAAVEASAMPWAATLVHRLRFAEQS